MVPDERFDDDKYIGRRGQQPYDARIGEALS
jgi:hypothetical protein